MSTDDRSGEGAPPHSALTVPGSGSRRSKPVATGADTSDVHAAHQGRSPMEPTVVARSPRPAAAGPVATDADSAPKLCPSDFGDYELLEEVARGGMGVVFKARHKRLNRIVALKVILSGEFAGEDDVQRFQSEAEAAAILQHPGIVPIYEVGQSGGRHFFSMGFIEGSTLAARVSKGPLDGDEAARLVAKVASAIAYAHQQGVIHRDLKPGNILLDSQNRPLVSDFGLAKRTDSDSQLTGTGQVIGTPNYMAPEQASGMNHLIGPCSDVYSLGAILYCLLTGRPPFHAASVMETLRQVIIQEPVPPRQLNASVDKDLETICLKCLQKDITARYASALELKADIERFLAFEPIEARPIGKLGRTLRWCQRNPVVSVLVFLIGLMTLTLAFAGPSVAIHQANMRATADQLNDDKAVLIGKLHDSMRETDEARVQAESNAGVMLENLVEMYVDRGNTELEFGDPITALPWYAAALKMNGTDADRAWANRVRLDSILHQAARPRQIWELGSEACSASLSGDGKLVAAAGRDGDVFVWDSDSGNRVFGPKRLQNSPVMALKFSSGRQRLLYAAGRSIQIWDPVTGEESFPTIVCKSSVRHADIDGECKLLSVGLVNGDVLLFDAQSGKRLRSITRHDDRIHRVEMCTETDRLVTASADHTARLFDLSTGEQIATLAHDGEVVWAEFDAQGAQLVTASHDGSVKVWNAETGRLVGGPLVHGARVRVASFDPTGRRVATGAWDSTARIWDVESGQMLVEPMLHANSVQRLQFSSDGQLLLTASIDHTARIWNAATGAPAAPAMQHGFLVQDARFLPGTNQVMTSSADRMVRIWDYETSANLLAMVHHQDNVRSSRFSPDGATILTASYDGSARIWNAETGQPLSEPMEHSSAINSAEFGPDGKWVVTASDDGTARVWSARDGSPVTSPLPHEQPVRRAEFSEDGSWVLTVCKDGVVRIWDVRSESVLRSLCHQKSVRWATFSADSQYVLTCCDDCSARVWDARTGQPISPPMTHRGRVERGCFSPDSRYCVTSSYDHTAQIWEARTGKRVSPPLVHRGGVYSVCFTPCGSHVVTGARDGTSRIWNVEDGTSVGPPMSTDRGLIRAVVSPCGRLIATAGGHGVRLWDARTGRQLASQMQHEDWLCDLSFSPDSSRIVSASEDGTARVWRVPLPDQRPVEQLQLLSRLVSGHQVDSQGGFLRPLEPGEMRAILDSLE